MAVFNFSVKFMVMISFIYRYISTPQLKSTTLFKRFKSCEFGFDAVKYITKELKLSDVVKEFLPEVNKLSETDHVAICPFHDDTNPSLRIYDTSGMYHCYACGAHGNAFKFVQLSQNLTFANALNRIMELLPPQEQRNRDRSTHLHYEKGLRYISTLKTPAKRKSVLPKYQIEPDVLQRIMDVSAVYFQVKLSKDPTSANVHAHLLTRKLHPDTITNFGIGYAPAHYLNQTMSYLASRMIVDGVDGAAIVSPSLTVYLLSKGFCLPDVIAAGFVIEAAGKADVEGDVTAVITPKHYDRFRDRMMIPIKNEAGDIVGFGGRAMNTHKSRVDKQDRQPAKYVNSPTSSLFKKGNLLYGMDLARPFVNSLGQVLIVEGYFDVISLHDADVENVVASMGTAITTQQLRLAASRACELTENPLEFTGDSFNEVILFLDNDKAGETAVHRLCTQVLSDITRHTNDTKFMHALATKLRIASITRLSKLEGGLVDDHEGPWQHALSGVKDASDLCVGVRNLIESKQLQISVSSVVRSITDAAIDWRLWMIDWIISEGVEAAGFGSIVAASEATKVVGTKPKPAMVSSIVDFISKAYGKSHDTVSVASNYTVSDEMKHACAYALTRLRGLDGCGDMEKELENIFKAKWALMRLQSNVANTSPEQSSVDTVQVAALTPTQFRPHRPPKPTIRKWISKQP